MISQVKKLLFVNRKQALAAPKAHAKNKVENAEVSEGALLNIEQELQTYLKPQESFSPQSELNTALEAFTQEVKRFGREQCKNTSQLEELLLQMEEQVEMNEALEEQLKNATAEAGKLLQSLIACADYLEEIYRSAQKNAASAWQEQLALQWERLGQALLFCGLTRIEGIGEEHQPKTQVATGTLADFALPAGTVLQVVKSGYLYCGQLLRKAEVIVNQPEQKVANQSQEANHEFFLD